MDRSWIQPITVALYSSIPGLVLAALLVIWRYFNKLQIEKLTERIVFITGCDTGFGYLLAIKLSQYGIPVIAGCLTKTGQKKLEQTTVGSPGKVETVLFNVTKQDSVDAAIKFVEEKTENKGALLSMYLQSCRYKCDREKQIMQKCSRI